MKKNLLFIMSNLECGGAEKALISLLQTIDYSKYNVDLLLFTKKGLFLNKVPKEVNILDEPFGYKYYDMCIKKVTIELIKKGRIKDLIGRLRSIYIYKTEKDLSRCNQRIWKYISRMFGKLDKEYDVAIGYLEGHPIYYCIDNVKARKKIGFIHNDYDKLGLNPIGDKAYFNKLDKIVTVSEECSEVLKKRFPEYKNKIDIMYNIVSPKTIRNLSLENTELNKDYINLVTVGRLNNQKGYDMAVESCKILVDKGYNIKWYAVGDGLDRKKLEKIISEKNIENNFILLGIKENPYSYINKADIYVQPSRFEGKSIAIDEAKILHKPIVVTNFSTVRDQIDNEVNGLIVEMTPQHISIGIEKLINNKEIKNKLVDNLKKEDLGNENEIEKFYKLCE